MNNYIHHILDNPIMKCNISGLHCKYLFKKDKEEICILTRQTPESGFCVKFISNSTEEKEQDSECIPLV